MKLNHVFLKLLTNKWVLTIVTILSLLTLIGYLMMHNLNAVIYFFLLALAVFYFSKNMILVLGIPLLLVNLLVYVIGVKEGLETRTSSSKPPVAKKAIAKKEVSTKAHDKPEKKTPQGLPRTKIDSDMTLNTSIDATDNVPHMDESFEVGRAKRGGGYNIDYASTVEDAYDELNKIIGGDGIKKLTDDTQRLMNQQLQLADAMKGMGPLIKGMAPLMQQAQGLLGGMKDGNGLGGIMEIAKQFSGKQIQPQA